MGATNERGPVGDKKRFNVGCAPRTGFGARGAPYIELSGR